MRGCIRTMSRATARSREPLSSASAQRCPAACTAPSGAAREQPNPHSPHRLALGVDGLAGALRIIAATERNLLVVTAQRCKALFDCCRRNGINLSMLSRARHETASMRNKNLGKGRQEPECRTSRPRRKRHPHRLLLGHFRRGARAVCGDRTAQLGASSVSIIRLADFGGTPAADAQHSNRVRRNCSPATLFSAS